MPLGLHPHAAGATTVPLGTISGRFTVLFSLLAFRDDSVVLTTIQTCFTQKTDLEFKSNPLKGLLSLRFFGS